MPFLLRLCVVVAIMGAIGQSHPAFAQLADRETAQAVCATQREACDWLAAMGSIERASVRRALRKLSRDLDVTPWGKPIGSVVVHVDPVFTEGYWSWLNALHAETRPQIVARESVLEAGAVWDQRAIDETARRLRDPLFASLAVVVPLQRADGQVDMLIVTRDIWSLRLNSNYVFQNQQLTNLTASLTEQNFLGRRKIVAGTFSMTQGTLAMGPAYIDKNVFGTGLKVEASGDLLFSRHTGQGQARGQREGSRSAVEFGMPLRFLASRWGYGVEFGHKVGIERLFKGTTLRTIDLPTTQGDDALPWVYRRRFATATISGVRQFGEAYKHRVSFGYTFEETAVKVLDNIAPAAQVAEYAEAILPRSERNSLVFLGYSLFEPRYRVLRNIDSFDLGEDVRFGPTLGAALAGAPRILGSTRDFVRGSLTAGWTFPWCGDGYVELAGSVGARYQGAWIDASATASGSVATPSNRWGRIVGMISLATRWNETQNRFYTVGSESGLRGFRIAEFSGLRKGMVQLEARSRPVKLWTTRLGGVLFYDGGGAANTVAQLGFHQDIGIGLRFLLPEFSRQLWRFDVAFPLDGQARGEPHIMSGFGSEF